jgi:hypothetical protein
MAPGGTRPFGIAFLTDGRRLAVGYDNNARVDVLDGQSLVPLHAAVTEGIAKYDLSKVAWAADGTLLAGGRHQEDEGVYPVLAWAAEGRAAPRRLPAGNNSVSSLVPLPDGDLLVATADPFLARLRPDGAAAWTLPPPTTDFSYERDTLAVSADGSAVEFGFTQNRRERARFDLARLTLTAPSPADGVTVPPRRRGLPIRNWQNSENPYLDGTPCRSFATRSRAVLPCIPKATASSSARSGRCAPLMHAAHRFGHGWRRPLKRLT